MAETHRLRDLVATSTPLSPISHTPPTIRPIGYEVAHSGLVVGHRLTRQNLDILDGHLRMAQVAEAAALPPAAFNQGGHTYEHQMYPAEENDPFNFGVVEDSARALLLTALNGVVENDLGHTYMGNYEQPGPSDDTLRLDYHIITENYFAPTQMALYGPGVQRPRTDLETQVGLVTNMSPNYMGDPSNIRNYSAIGLPDHLNTSFWIENLPVDVQCHEIFNAIRDCGTIYALHINRGDAEVLGHAACKLVFMRVSGATRFYEQYVNGQNLFVREQRASIRRNRNKVAEQMGLPSNYSRVLLISGNKKFVNMRFLTRMFDGHFKYQLERVVSHFDARRKKSTIEIRFGSYRAQANMAMKMLRTAFFRRMGITAQYYRDPCDHWE